MSRRRLLTEEEHLQRAARRQVMGATRWAEAPTRPDVQHVYGGTDEEPEEAP